mgnify:CR=1 FL=1
MNDEEIEIIDCICSWYDLLGYGTPFVEANWNLHDEQCKKNVDRMVNLNMLFHTSWSITPCGTRLAFNDGFASTIDIDVSSSEHYNHLLFFLEGAIKDFSSINHFDKEKGFPGIRGIITYGQRFSYDPCSQHYDVITKQTISYFPVEFQMNTAFSKAFILEESGSRANITGNNLYFDITVYKFLEQSANTIGFHPPEVFEQEDDFLVKIYDINGWFADLRVEKDEIVFGESTNYNNRGIKTTLYKYKSLHSKIDDYAKDVAYQQFCRYAKIEDDE